MPQLKVLSGKQIVKILLSFNFQITSQRGSHIKLVRIEEGFRQILTIPNHIELDRGTLRAIYKQASHYIAESELRPYFYTL